jgi:hypothetical protein
MLNPTTTKERSMDPQDHTPESGTPSRGRAKLAALLGVAALAIPGGALVSNALAADSDGGTSTQQTQQAPDGYGTAPVQDESDGTGPDGRDCPKENGDSGSSGSGGGTTTTPETSTEQPSL